MNQRITDIQQLKRTLKENNQNNWSLMNFLLWWFDLLKLINAKSQHKKQWEKK